MRGKRCLSLAGALCIAVWGGLIWETVVGLFSLDEKMGTAEAKLCENGERVSETCVIEQESAAG